MRPYSLKQLIQQHLSKRRASQPRYSIAALAREWGVEATHLSRYLKKESGLSLREVQNILNALSCTTLEREFILSDCLLKNLESDQETSELVKEWYEMGILSLMKSNHFQNDPSWISKRLNVEETLVRSALGKLTRSRRP